MDWIPSQQSSKVRPMRFAPWTIGNPQQHLSKMHCTLVRWQTHPPAMHEQNEHGDRPWISTGGTGKNWCIKKLYWIQLVFLVYKFSLIQNWRYIIGVFLRSSISFWQLIDDIVVVQLATQLITTYWPTTFCALNLILAIMKENSRESSKSISSSVAMMTGFGSSHSAWKNKGVWCGQKAVGLLVCKEYNPLYTSKIYKLDTIRL